MNFVKSDIKIHDIIAIKNPLIIENTIPIEEIIIASSSSCSPSFLDIIFPLPYPNQKPIA